MAKIIQWNINSLSKNRAELDIIFKDNPSLVSLQETKLREPMSFRDYKTYDVFAQASDGRACGGVSLLVHNKIPQAEIQLVYT
jgi:exonuclease III